MKNKKLFTAVVIAAIWAFLITGCSPRNQAQPVNSGSQTQTGGSQDTGKIQNPADNMLKVHFIDVGQGDAILVQTPAGQNMLVDAGENDYGSQVVTYLKAQGIKELDVVVGTHPHSDHIGGLDTVINAIPVKKVFMPKVTTNTQSYRDVLKTIENRDLKITEAKAGVSIALDGVECGFIAPLNNKYEDLNNHSAVIKLNYGSQSFLLTGDAGTESENQILASNANLKSSVLKVGHHGSYGSTGVKFLKAVSPQYAVIMVGQGNDYGHPHAQILTRLKEARIKVLRTDQSGTIVMATDGNNITVNPSK